MRTEVSGIASCLVEYFTEDLTCILFVLYDLRSGGGKSTVVQLLERFYDPTSGSISLDGREIKDLNVKWLRQNIGLVSQEPKLFACSIRDNIKIGCPNATQEEIEAAAKKANAHDFVSSFPNGYDTDVGNEGTQLSGGAYNA